MVPPLIEYEMDPFELPKQATGVLVTDALSGANGVVTVALPEPVSEQELASETLTMV